ncbi:hypothetical protein [Gluconacetobacter diazotrophicus]|uniref:hypothetical protein n=1 Tax=Gluconacetobacter diazotrophicus TaxID=33996 RepID=UPI0012FF2D57|nr:hypothetical protein [Gluconacetobacter diazotrophicus]
MPLILLSVFGFIKDNWKYFLIGGVIIGVIGFAFHIKSEIDSVHKLKSEVSDKTQQVQLFSQSLDQQKTINNQINQSYNNLLSQDQGAQQTISTDSQDIKKILRSNTPVVQKQADVSTRINADLDMLGGAQ